MPENRILPLVGAAATLYLIADAYVRTGSFTPLESIVALLAALIGLAPVFAQRLRRERVRTHRAYTWLCIALGLATASTLGAHELYEIIGTSSGVVAAAVLFDLAIMEPDRIPAHRRLRLLGFGSLGALFALNFLARAEPEGILPDDFLLPSHFEIDSGEILLLSATLSLLLRMARRRLGSTPRALAANAWGVLTLALTVPFFVGAVFITRSVEAGPLEGEAPAFLFALASAGLSLGHVAVFFEERSLVSGAALRRILAVALPVFVFSVGAALIAAREGYDPLPAAAIVAGILLGGTLLARLVERPIHVLFAPNHGRLLDALKKALDSLHDAATLDDLAQAILTPLRDHHESPSPVLALRAPGRIYRLDAAGLVRSEDRALSEALRTYLDDPGAEPLFRDELEERAVRDVASRPLLEAMRGHRAEVIVPCPADGENQGALLFADSDLGLPHSMEELGTLLELGARIGARLVAFQEARRTNQHIHSALIEREELARELDALHARVRILESTAHTPPPRSEAPLVAYSPAMREVLERLDAFTQTEVNETPTPLFFFTPPGGPEVALAWEAHRRMEAHGERTGPFIVHDAQDAGSAESAPRGKRSKDEELITLLGREDGPLGLVGRADGGTLFIRSIEKLGRKAQRVLAEILRDGRYRAVDGVTIRPIRIRLLVSSTRPFDELKARASKRQLRVGVLHPELSRMIGGRIVRIPPLSERAEDLDSLILLAIDHAARALGKESPGIYEEAAARLRSGPFPGDELGLRWRLYAAVASTDGVMLDPSALALSTRPNRDDPRRSLADEVRPQSATSLHPDEEAIEDGGAANNENGGRKKNEESPQLGLFQVLERDDE